MAVLKLPFTDSSAADAHEEGSSSAACSGCCPSRCRRLPARASTSWSICIWYQLRRWGFRSTIPSSRESWET